MEPESPNASTRTSLPGRGSGGTGGPCSERVVHQEIRCAEIWLQHELSWMQISDDGHDSHTEECRRRFKNCLSEDEETKFRSEAPKLRVES